MESTAENTESFQRSILAVDFVPVLLRTIMCQTGTGANRHIRLRQAGVRSRLILYDARCVK